MIHPAVIGAIAGARRSGSSAITAQTAIFDGTDYARQSANPTGQADSKVFTLSTWVKFSSGDGVAQNLFVISDSGTTKLALLRDSANKLWIFGRNAAGSTILNVVSTTSITADGNWHHVYVCCNMANEGASNIYLDGADAGWSKTTFSNDTLDIAGLGTPRTTIGSNGGGTSNYYGSLAELWFDDSFLDSVGSFASGGHPISLGTTGETPTGSAPIRYHSLSGSGNSWATDSSGNGNNLTVTGTLGTDTSP